jgi:hypothetical protein
VTVELIVKNIKSYGHCSSNDMFKKLKGRPSVLSRHGKKFKNPNHMSEVENYNI